MRYHPASVPETLPVSTGGHWASKSSGLSGTNNAGSAVTAATSLRLKNSTAVLLISGSSSKYVFMISNSRPVAPLDFTNTNWDRSYEKAYEKGINTYIDGSHGGGRTATGSGPVTWYHDGTPAGIADLCGNCWE